MSDKIARVTPREIAEMLVNEQAYADTRFVLAAEHDAEIERLRARVAVLSDALSGTHTWLGVAIQCPAFRWDADQKQAAQHDYDDARAALEVKP
jgi:hypothetical protein